MFSNPYVSSSDNVEMIMNVYMCKCLVYIYIYIFFSKLERITGYHIVVDKIQTHENAQGKPEADK